MKTNLFALTAAAVLFSVPALAQHAGYAVQQNGYTQDGDAEHQAYGAQPPAGNPDDHCDHDRAHRGEDHHRFLKRRGGRYELRATQKWVEGYYQNVWVPGSCFGHVVQVCSPGYYRQDWVPGRYVTEQQWVFVEHRERRYYRAWGRRHY